MMRKITLILTLLLMTLMTNLGFAQHVFPTITGPSLVAEGTPVTINVNDVGNAAAVPASSTGSYSSFSISVAWSDDNNAWSNEADLTVTTTAGSVLIDPATSGGGTSGAATTLVFDGDFSGPYNPQVDGVLDVVLNQSYPGSSANWANIVVTIYETPSCIDPSTLQANNATTNTVDLQWNDPSGSQTNFEYAIQTQGTGVPAGAGVAISATSINGVNTDVASNPLIPATSYEVWVRADCGGGDFSAWVGPVNFTTLCVSFTAPFLESFETPALPNCWAQGGATPWEYGSLGGGTPAPNFADYGANGVQDHSTSGTGTFIGIDGSDHTDGEVSTLTTPLVDISGLSSPYLSYYVFSNNINDAAQNELMVEFFDGASWNTVETIQANLGNDWVMYGVDLTAFTISGDVQARFTITGVANGGWTYYNDILIDDVSFDEAPTCFDPNSVTVSNVTATSFDLNWPDNSGGQQYDFYYVVQPQGTGTGGTLIENYLDISTLPLTVTCTDDLNCGTTMLTPNTAYEVYVRADCSGNWVGPFNFSTLCVAIDTFPFVETFNTDSTTESCWTVIDGNTDGDQWNMNGTTIPLNGQAAQLYTDFNSVNNDYLVSPQLDLGVDAKRLKFWVRHFSNAEPDNLNVKVSTTGSDIPSFTNTELTLSTTQITTTYTEYIVDLSAYTGNSIFIAFAREDAPADGWYLSIDNVTVEDIPTTPPACATNVVGTPHATCGNFNNALSWDVVSGADGYYLTIGTTSGGNEVLDNQDLGNTTTYNFVGVINTTYYFTVVPYNANGSATACSEVSFSTAATGCYCTSSPTSNDGNGITNVDIATTSFPNGDVFYFDHTATVVDLAQGINSNVQITFATGYTYGTNIWIDFNDDYDFDDAGELVFTGESTNANPTTFDASFMMPGAAPLGVHRMRIGTADTGQNPPNPCYSGTWGVTLDFAVNIVAASCSPATVASSTIVPNCGTSEFSVDVDVTDLGDGTPLITDGTTTWPVSATGVVTVGPFAFGTVTLTVLHGADNTCDVSLGNFTYTICPPANDDLCNATPLTIGAAATGSDYTLEGATIQTDEPTPGCWIDGTLENSVWFSFVAPSTDVEVTTDFAGGTLGGGDTQIAIYDATGVVCTDLNSLPANVGCDDDGGTTVNFSSYVTLSGLTPGTTYYIQVDSYDGSAQGTFGIQVNDLLSTSNFNANGFVAYPNPVKDVLTLAYSSDISSVRVINMLGQEVLSRTFNATSAQVDMSQLAAGTYLVNVTSGDVQKTIKVVKQ